MKYEDLMAALKQLHAEQMRDDVAGNAEKLGKSLLRMRQTCNLLIPFINRDLEMLATLERTLGAERERLYKEDIAAGKSRSAANDHASNMTKKLSGEIKAMEYQVEIKKNDFNRFDTLCYALKAELQSQGFKDR